MWSEAEEVREILHLDEHRFDPRGDRSNGDGSEGIRGGLPYSKPGPQWKSIGISVSGRYDRGSDDWLKHEGNPGEWAIGYRPLFRYLADSQLFDSIALRQEMTHDVDLDASNISEENPYGAGLVFTENIDLARRIVESEIDSNQTLLICKARLNPREISIPEDNPTVRIVSSQKDARVYAICILEENSRKSHWNSIGSHIYRSKPTAADYKASQNVRSRIIESSEMAQDGLDILQSACENIGAELVFTDKDGESDLDLLPTLLQKGKLASRISFTLTSDENYDSIFRGDIDVINSPYIKKLKRDIASFANVKYTEIDVTSVKRGSVIVRGTGPKEMDIQALKCRLPKYEISVDARELQAILMLSEDDFDSRGDNYRFTGTDGMGGIRGGMTYKQPGPEWKRIGMRVRGKYDDGNDDWLETGGKAGEWAIGFHGPGSLKAAQGISGQRSVRAGYRQLYTDDVDVNPQSDNQGKPCGDGAYFAEDIETAKGYAEDGVSKETKMLVFQARLNPRKVRIPKTCRWGYRIVPTPEDSRIYGICIRDTNYSKETTSKQQPTTIIGISSSPSRVSAATSTSAHVSTQVDNADGKSSPVVHSDDKSSSVPAPSSGGCVIL